MDNLIQSEAEMKQLKCEKPFGSFEGDETNEGTAISIKDRDTMLTMIVLLLASLGLAVLAHAVI